MTERGLKYGKLFASCGHEIPHGDETFTVMYASEECDAVDGFQPCVVYAEYCRACADELKADKEVLSFATDAEATAWLEAQR